MARLDPRRLERLLASFERLHLLVVGDAMLDEYLWGAVERVSPEAPVPVVHVKRESVALGGAANVVRNAVAMGARGTLCAVAGRDPAGDRLVDLLKDLGVEAAGVVRVEGRPTTRKTRVEARAQQVVRLDRETEAPVPADALRALLRAVEDVLPRAQGVVLEDYAKGVLAPRLVRSLLRRAGEVGLPVAVDPKGDVGPYRGAALVKPNLREVEQLTGVRASEPEGLGRAVEKLRRRLPGSALVVTRGADGMTVFPEDGPGVDVPIARSEVFDVQGAGDTAIAALSLARLAGASLVEAAVLANAASAVVVGKVGTATASPAEILDVLPDALAAARRGGRAT